MVWVTETGSRMDFNKHIKILVALLNRIFKLSLIKFLLYFPKHWKSCIWSWKLLVVIEVLLPWAEICLQLLQQGISGEVSSTFESWRKWRWVISSFAATLRPLPWAETLHLLFGREQGVSWRKAGLWKSAVLHSLKRILWNLRGLLQQTLCMAHTLCWAGLPAGLARS